MNATSTTEYTGHGNSGGGVAGAILIYLLIFVCWYNRKINKNNNISISSIIRLGSYQYELHQNGLLTPKKSLNPLRRNNSRAVAHLLNMAVNQEIVTWNNEQYVIINDGNNFYFRRAANAGNAAQPVANSSNADMRKNMAVYW